MGLRDWVSEKGAVDRTARAGRAGFNGAPRLGLGDGASSGRRALGESRLQWGSETGSRRWAAIVLYGAGAVARFNGAPRLGLGDGLVGRARLSATKAASMGLRDWVSEMALDATREALRRLAASMGLRDWVSEMAAASAAVCARMLCFNGAPRLGLGDGPRPKPTPA